MKGQAAWREPKVGGDHQPDVPRRWIEQAEVPGAVGMRACDEDALVGFKPNRSTRNGRSGGIDDSAVQLEGESGNGAWQAERAGQAQQCIGLCIWRVVVELHRSPCAKNVLKARDIHTRGASRFRHLDKNERLAQLPSMEAG